MKRWRILAVLSLPLLLAATIPMDDRVTVWLNRPGVELRSVPAAWLEKVRKKLGADELRVGTDSGIIRIDLIKQPEEKAQKITTTADLRTWFIEKECLKGWESFGRCLNENRNRADEVLYHHLEKEFVSNVQCRERCEDPSFKKWRFQWVAPAYMELQADIGTKGGFDTLEDAKKSLHRINGLLKKVLYGARFPEGFGEGRTEYETFAVDMVQVRNFDFKHGNRRLLWRLKEAGYLHGIDGGDIDAMEKSAKPGYMIYYIPPECTGGDISGWYAVYNSAHIRFDRRYCPRIRILR